MAKKPTQKPDPDFWQRWGVLLTAASLFLSLVLGWPTIKAMIWPPPDPAPNTGANNTPGGNNPAAPTPVPPVATDMLQRHGWLNELRDTIGYLAVLSHQEKAFLDAENVLLRILATRQVYLVRYSLKGRVEGYWAKVRAYKANPTEENRKIVADDCSAVADLISDLLEDLLKRPLASETSTRPS